MGTEARIIVYARTERAARDATSHAFARIAALDAVMSDYRDDSELAALCRRAGGGAVRISDDLFRVLQESQRLARVSGGAFDVTAGPLTHLWRRARRLDELPPEDRIRAALAVTGADKLIVRGRTAELQLAGMQIDLGGIGKGFAADEAAVILKRDGIRAALIAIGGDIVAIGAPPGAAGWTVATSGIPGPASGMRDTGSEAQAPPDNTRIVLRDAAVSTSGDAEQWLDVGGVRYSHIIDPHTGMALTGRRAVTVVARQGALADGLATAVSVMGPAAGLDLVNRTAGCAARFSIAQGGEVRTMMSSRWPDYLAGGGSGPISTRRNSTSEPSAWCSRSRH